MGGGISSNQHWKCRDNNKLLFPQNPASLMQNFLVNYRLVPHMWREKRLSFLSLDSFSIRCKHFFKCIIVYKDDTLYTALQAPSLGLGKWAQGLNPRLPSLGIFFGCIVYCSLCSIYHNSVHFECGIFFSLLMESDLPKIMCW